MSSVGLFRNSPFPEVCARTPPCPPLTSGIVNLTIPYPKVWTYVSSHKPTSNLSASRPAQSFFMLSPSPYGVLSMVWPPPLSPSSLNRRDSPSFPSTGFATLTPRVLGLFFCQKSGFPLPPVSLLSRATSLCVFQIPPPRHNFKSRRSSTSRELSFPIPYPGLYDFLIFSPSGKNFYALPSTPTSIWSIIRFSPPSLCTQIH